MAVLLSGSVVSACGGSHQATITHNASARVHTQYVRQDFGDYDADEYERKNYKVGTADGDNDDPWDGDALDPHGTPDGDNDHDNKTGSYFDADDKSLFDSGRAARPAEAHAINALVHHYYEIAAAGDGAQGCALLQSPIANSIAEDLGRPPGPPYYRGNTCPAVVTKVFRVNHVQLATYAESLKVSAIRISGRRGIVIMAFRHHPGRQLGIVRESGGWKVAVVVDSELP